jgi:hypothetical protein
MSVCLSVCPLVGYSLGRGGDGREVMEKRYKKYPILFVNPFPSKPRDPVA